MDKPGDAVHADQLCALVGAALDAGNGLLAALVRQRRDEAVDEAPFVFTPAPGQPAQAIPATHFHRPCALALEALELTLHGYCVLRKPGWTRLPEPVLALGRPPWWRRLLRPPLLALGISARGGAVHASVTVARRHDAIDDGRRRDIRLPPHLQEALLQIHRAQAAPWFRKRRTPPASP